MTFEHFRRGTRLPDRTIHVERAMECPYCHSTLGQPCIQSGGGVASHSHSGRFKLYEQLHIAATRLSPTEEPG